MIGNGAWWLGTATLGFIADGTKTGAEMVGLSNPAFDDALRQKVDPVGEGVAAITAVGPFGLAGVKPLARGIGDFVLGERVGSSAIEGAQAGSGVIVRDVSGFPSSAFDSPYSARATKEIVDMKRLEQEIMTSPRPTQPLTFDKVTEPTGNRGADALNNLANDIRGGTAQPIPEPAPAASPPRLPNVADYDPFTTPPAQPQTSTGMPRMPNIADSPDPFTSIKSPEPGSAPKMPNIADSPDIFSSAPQASAAAPRTIRESFNTIRDESPRLEEAIQRLRTAATPEDAVLEGVTVQSEVGKIRAEIGNIQQNIATQNARASDAVEIQNTINRLSTQIDTLEQYNTQTLKQVRQDLQELRLRLEQSRSDLPAPTFFENVQLAFYDARDRAYNWLTNLFSPSQILQPQPI